jgi:hypothetical protein
MIRNADIKDWYDESSGGLSGGQIAGIVVSTAERRVVLLLFSRSEVLPVRP